MLPGARSAEFVEGPSALPSAKRTVEQKKNAPIATMTEGGGTFGFMEAFSQAAEKEAGS
jgi:hypothetical protein